MGIGKDEIVEAVAAMSVADLMEMVKAIEARFGVSAAVASAPAPVAQREKEEQLEFAVRVLSVRSDSRVSVIKAIREITGLGLKEAKDMADTAYPVGSVTVREQMSRSEAEIVAAKLIRAGCVAELV